MSLSPLKQSNELFTSTILLLLLLYQNTAIASGSVRSHKQRLITHTKTIPATSLKEWLINQADEIKGLRLGVKGKKENGQTAVARCKSVLSCLVVNIKELIASPLNKDQTSNGEEGRASARTRGSAPWQLQWVSPRDHTTHKHNIISSGRYFCTTFTSTTFLGRKAVSKVLPVLIRTRRGRPVMATSSHTTIATLG